MLSFKKALKKYNTCIRNNCENCGLTPDGCGGEVKDMGYGMVDQGCGVGVYNSDEYDGRTNYVILAKSASMQREKVDHDKIAKLNLIKKRMEALIDEAFEVMDDESPFEKSIGDSVVAIEDAIEWLEITKDEEVDECNLRPELSATEALQLYTFNTMQLIDTPDDLEGHNKKVWDVYAAKVVEINKKLEDESPGKTMTMELINGMLYVIDNSRGHDSENYHPDHKMLNHSVREKWAQENCWFNFRDQEEDWNHDIGTVYKTLAIRFEIVSV